nr:hypothetical protein [Bathymodiolus platifrons methanotrophic gill symbiont]
MITGHKIKLYRNPTNSTHYPIFDHAAKSNQSKYPWAQNIVSVGLLKQVKGRWACLFLDFRFYLPLKTIQGKKETGAPCYLTKFRDSCRRNSFTYAANRRCSSRPASATD